MRLACFHRDERAQGLIEFALISTALLLLFAGTVDFSRFMYYSTAINSAARVGASLGTNACLTPELCGRTVLPTDSYVMQAASCEAKPYVSLQPQISCDTCITSTCTTPCDPSSCPSPCAAEDICVQRSLPSGAPADGQTVIVTVGYHFDFISPILGQFFPNVACFTGDTRTHNICAHATGIVF
jgi:hypothetical protein